MRNPAIILFAALFVTGLAASCNKELDAAYGRQEEDIAAIVDGFVKADPTVKVRYQAGSTRVTTVGGQGDSLSADGAVSFYYAGYSITGRALSRDALFVTNYDVFAKSVKWNLSDTTRFAISTVQLADDTLIEGLRNGLAGVRAGEECYVLFSGKHAFPRNRKFGPIPANSALAYHLWIQSVSNE